MLLTFYRLFYFTDPTTSNVTTATFIYASGAGITAAAGTRLALHWKIRRGPFRPHPCQVELFNRSKCKSFKEINATSTVFV